MTTASPKPQGFPWVSPYIMVKDVDAATDFYSRVFGFILREKASMGGDVSIHAEMTYKDQLVMFGREGEYEGKKTAKSPQSTQTECPVSLCIYCEDVDQFYREAVSKGAKSLEAPVDMPWGDRVCRLQCPDGYSWSFATHLGVPCSELKQNK